MSSLFLRVATSDAVGHVLPPSKKMPHAGVAFTALEPPGIVIERHTVWCRVTDTEGRLAALAAAIATVEDT